MTEQLTRPRIYDQLHASRDFRDARTRYRRFAIPWTIAFFSWYMLFVVCCMWAGDFMNDKVVGNVNVALVFGLLQFVSTFVIAGLYARHASRNLDPLAERIVAGYEAEVSS